MERLQSSTIVKDSTYVSMVDEFTCQNCGIDIRGIYLEPPYLVAVDGGTTLSTPNEPGESWVRGIQKCCGCDHEWEIELY